MGDFVTSQTTTLADLLPDGAKSTAPGVSYRPGWTSDNVLRASEVNAIADALLDARTAIRGLVFNVIDYGALGDGATDDTAAIQAALTAAAGGTCYFPPPASFYRITGALTVLAGTLVTGGGVGGVEIRVDAGATHAVFDVDGVARVQISGFRLTKAAGADLTGAAYGVYVRGSATDVLVENLQADGFVRGFQVAGGEGSAAGTVERATFRFCRAVNSPSSWGFNVDDADVVMFDDCHASANWLDGFKLRKLALNVTIAKGSSNGNGVGYLSNPALYAGDGMDAYAGGDTFLVDGFTCEDNYGSGLTIKTGELNKLTPGDYGYVRNVQVIGARLRNNLVGSGLYLALNNPGDNAEPLVNAVAVVGGVFEGNAAYGIYVASRNVMVVAPIVRDNQQHGIVTALRALDVEIVNPLVLGNGRGTANTYDGISVNGSQIRIRGGTFIGADAATVGIDGDYAALTKYQRYPINVTSTATNVRIEAGRMAYHATLDKVVTAQTSGACVVTNHLGTSTPISEGIYGSVGSTYIRTNASTPEDVAWIKGSGNPNAPTTGWQRITEAHSVLTRGDAGLALAAGSARTLIYTAAITADRDVSVPTALLYGGMRFRIVRTAASGGAFNINVKDGVTTLKALASGQWCEVEYTGSAWYLVAFGSL